MGLKHKIMISFVAFIVIPYCVVGALMFHQATEMTKRQVSDTLYRLAKQNGLTVSRTLESMNQSTLKFIDDNFVESAKQAKKPIDLARITTVAEYNSLNNMIENYALDGTKYAVYTPAVNEETRSFARDDGVTSGLIFLESEEYPLFYKEAEALRGTGILRAMPSGASGYPTVCFIRAIVDPIDASRVMGVLYVRNVETLLFNDIWDSQIPAGTKMYLLNGEREVLTSEPAIRPGTPVELPDVLIRERNSYRILQWNEEPTLFTSVYNQKFRTQLIYEVPIIVITGDQLFYRNVLLVILFASFALVAAYLLYLLRLMLSPLNRLSRLTEKYEPGMTFSLDSWTGRNDEIGKVYGSFHRMTERVNQLVEERYTLELKQQQMELMTLHTQITPHLLYNTLDSIYWSAVDKDEPVLAGMVKDLSSLLRIGLSRGRELVTVREELQHIQAYIRLQLLRYRDTFSVHWGVMDEVLDEVTPKVILQPIVENAILHGVGKMDGEGEIWIKGMMAEDCYILLVEDNGFKPADPDKLRRLMEEEQAEGYGVRNVNRRIQLHFGPGYGIRYAYREDGGTVAEIRMPRRDVAKAQES